MRLKDSDPVLVERMKKFHQFLHKTDYISIPLKVFNDQEDNKARERLAERDRRLKKGV